MAVNPVLDVLLLLVHNYYVMTAFSYWSIKARSLPNTERLLFPPFMAWRQYFLQIQVNAFTINGSLLWLKCSTLFNLSFKVWTLQSFDVSMQLFLIQEKLNF